jgi:opacity protein-like surface antigen
MEVTLRFSKMWRVLPLTLALLAPASRVAGQGPISLGVGGGLAMPFGALGNVANTGWRAMGTLAVGVPLVPVGLRVDASYDRFGFQKSPIGAAGSETGSQSIFAGTVNGTLRLSPLPLITPYAIAGLGPYHVSCSGPASCESSTRFGYNAGLGIRFGALLVHGFAEVRYHYVPVPGGSVQYVPVTVGLLF